MNQFDSEFGLLGHEDVFGVEDRSGFLVDGFACLQESWTELRAPGWVVGLYQDDGSGANECVVVDHDSQLDREGEECDGWVSRYRLGGMLGHLQRKGGL